MKIHSSAVDLGIDKDVVLVTGDGRTLINDMERFLEFNVPHDVMAIGRSIHAYPGRVKHWANVDGSECIWWAENLPLKNNGKMPIRHTLGEVRGYDVDWDDGKGMDEPWNGSSALFAVMASLTLGYKKIVLAGCPIDSKGHWYFDETITGPDWAKETFEAWREFSKTPESQMVKSLSGFTKELLGEPRKEWLDGK